MELESGIVDRLDTLRYESPKEALTLAESVLTSKRIPPEIAPGFFGAYGSTLRMLGDLEGAKRAIEWGLHLAKGDTFMNGRLHLRLAYVQADRLDHPKAIDLAKRATAEFHLAGAEDWAAISLCDRGRWTQGMGRADQAIEIFEASLDQLGADTPELWRIANYVGIAVSQESMGRPEEGIEWLEKLEGASLSPWHERRVAWAEARLLTSLGEFLRAQELFEDIIVFFEGKNEVDVFMARLELAETFLKAGSAREGRALVRDVAQKIPRLFAAR